MTPSVDKPVERLFSIVSYRPVNHLQLGIGSCDSLTMAVVGIERVKRHSLVILAKTFVVRKNSTTLIFTPNTAPRSPLTDESQNKRNITEIA